MHVLDGCSHALPREAPDELNRIIDAFLERHPSRNPLTPAARSLG
jgi:hypothetical protein